MLEIHVSQSLVNVSHSLLFRRQSTISATPMLRSAADSGDGGLS